MKKVLSISKLLSIIIFLTISIQLKAQQNDFKIGVLGDNFSCWVNGDNCACISGNYNVYPYKYKQGHETEKWYSSVYGVYEEDGINFIRTYLPDLWITQENYRKFISLVGMHNITLIDDNEGWYKSEPGYKCLTHAHIQNYYNPNDNIYDMSSNLAVYNYNSLYNNTYNKLPYKNYVYGHMISGESNYYHWHPYKDIFPPDYAGDNCQFNIRYYNSCEVPPLNISDAFAHFQSMANNLGHKLFQVQAVHGGIISNVTHDSDGVYNVAEYLNIPNKGDIFLEGSYFHKNWDQWIFETIPTNSDYLGKYKSIDYAKQYYNNIFVEIDLEYSLFYGVYNHNWHSNSNIPNGNNTWFQAYNSIIHGAKGVIFWGVFDSWEINNNTETPDINNKANFYNNKIKNDNFKINNFPNVYQTCISNLTKQLRYLKDKNFLSDDEGSIVCTKTTLEDPNCILPSSTTYLPYIVDGIAARDLTTLLCTEEYGNHCPPYMNYHRTEDFGIRYTIRTNGDEVIMIATNPNPYSVFSVPFDFNSIANPIIRNSTAVEVLFESNSLPVTDLQYKRNRNWIDRTIFKNNINGNGNINNITSNILLKYPKQYQSSTNKTLTLDFWSFRCTCNQIYGNFCKL